MTTGRPSILCLAADGYHGRGGIAQYVRDVVRTLCAREAEYDVQFLSRFSSPAHAAPAGVSQTPCDGSRWRFAARSIAAADRTKPICIYCFHVHYLPLAVLLAYWQARPLILFTYGVDVWRLNGRLLRWCIRRAHRVVTISRHTRKVLIEQCGVAPHRVRLLPNCIDTDSPTVDPRHLATLATCYGLHGKRVLLTVGRLSANERYKGHDRVIRALPDVVTHVSDLRYVIVGDGDDRTRLESLARDCGVSAYVVFSGELTAAELYVMYALADGFTMPSTDEGFGFVYLEALRAGLPIVALDAAGTPDALAHSTLSRLVARDDPVALAAALVACLTESKAAPRHANHDAIRPFARDRFRTQLQSLMTIAREAA